jgi:hypothetical protein
VQLAAEGAGDGNYRWYDPNRQLIDGSTDSLFTTSHLTDSATYYVTAINAEGCESEMTPIVAAVIKTEVEAGEDDTLSYASDTVALEPGKPGHGLWYGSDAVVDSLYFDLSAGTGSYGLTYEVDVEGCKFNDTRTVVVEKATQTITFDNLHDITFDQSPVNLSATSGSGLPVSFVLSEGDGTINGDKLTIDSTGVFTIHAIQEGNSNYLAADTVTRSFTVSKGTATISLSALNQTYDGAGKKVAVETTPAGLAVETLYEGSPELPVDAGKYEIVVTIEDDNYAGMVTDSLEIAKAEATIEFSNLEQVYDGNGKSVDLTVTPGGLNTEVLYKGSAKLPVNAGRYEVVATIQDENYEGSLSDSLEITKATASVTLSDMEQTYDGTGKSVEVQTEPSGLSVSVMYDGSETLPVDAGEYKVSASVDDNNWQGTTTGVIKIQKQTATIEISDLEHEYDGSAKEVTITTTPAGLDYEVTYDGSSTAPVEAGTYEVVAEIAENNYKGSASAEMTINEEAQTGLTDIMNGNIRIYPNPFDDRVKVILPEERSFHYLKISSLTGSVVAVRRIYKNEKILTLDLASLEEGIYILTLYSDKGRYNLKMNKISQYSVF